MSGPRDPGARSARPPKINAMLICERAMREETSGQVSVIGTYEIVNATQFPTVIPNLYLCIKLTEAQGEYVFRLEMVRRDDLNAVGEVTLPSVTVKDPLDHSEILLQLLGVPLPQPGHYDFRLWANDRFVDSKSLLAKLNAPTKPDGSAAPDPAALNVRVVGSTVIARVPGFALKTPKPAAPVANPPPAD